MSTRKAEEFDREMQALEGEIKRLEAEYNMFFAGRLPKLPWETRARVEGAVKRWDRARLTNTAQRFRFMTLQSRFAAFCELWERHLKAREEGRPAPGRQRGGAAPASRRAAPPVPPATAEAGGTDRGPSRPADGIVHVATVSDPVADRERLRELYDRIGEARRAAGEPPIAADRLDQLVRAQVLKLGAGGRAVAFRVAVRNGKVTLTAKAAGPGDE